MKTHDEKPKVEEQELPPLDVTDEEKREGFDYVQGLVAPDDIRDELIVFAGRYQCRERQLLAALHELKAKSVDSLSPSEEGRDLTYFLRLTEHKLDQRLQGQYTEKILLGMLLKLASELLLKHKIPALNVTSPSIEDK